MAIEVGVLKERTEGNDPAVAGDHRFAPGFEKIEPTFDGLRLVVHIGDVSAQHGKVGVEAGGGATHEAEEIERFAAIDISAGNELYRPCKRGGQRAK
jgi:hypothetical protein